MCFPSHIMGLPMGHAQWMKKSPHGAQLKLMIIVHMSVDRANGVIVTQNVPVMVQTALSKKVMKVQFNQNCRLLQTNL